MEELIIFIVWGIIALVSFILKQRQNKTSDWDDDEEWESTDDGGWKPAEPAKAPRKQEEEPKHTPLRDRYPSTKQNPNPKPQPKPQPKPAQASREQPRPTPQPQARRQPSAAEQARSLIEDAIRKQQQTAAQESRRTVQETRLAAEPQRLPSEPRASVTPPPLPQAKTASDMGDLASAMGHQPRRRNKKSFDLDFKSAKTWRQAVVAREVLARPRAFDT